MLRFVCMWLILLALAIPSAYAAETEEDQAAPPGDAAEPEAEETVVEEQPMTQGDLAVAIVRMLGLNNELEPNASKLDYIDFLRGRGIHLSPALPAWDPNGDVTKEVLAVVVVQVLGLLAEVEDRTNVLHFIAVLEERDLILTSVRDVLSEIEVVNPLVQIVRGYSSAEPYERNLSTIRGR